MNIKDRIKQGRDIIDGYHNYLFRDDYIEFEARRRLLKCNNCSYKIKDIIGTEKCKICGCPLQIKVRSQAERCDLGEW